MQQEVMGSSLPSSSQVSGVSNSSDSATPSYKLITHPSLSNKNDVSDAGHESLDHYKWNRQTAPAAFLHYQSIRRVGIAQLFSAFLCLSISLALIVDTDKNSAGSGIWCSAIFILVSVLNLTGASLERQFRVSLAFAATCIYFAILMMVVEVVELVSDFNDKYIMKASVAMHATSVLLAFLEIIFTSISIQIYCRERKCRINPSPKMVMEDVMCGESPTDVILDHVA